MTEPFERAEKYVDVGLVGPNGLELRGERELEVGLGEARRTGEGEGVRDDESLAVSTTRAVLGLNLVEIVPTTDLRRLLIDRTFDGFCRERKRGIQLAQSSSTPVTRS